MVTTQHNMASLHFPNGVSVHVNIFSVSNFFTKSRFTHSMPCPCRAAKGLCLFPTWFIQCGRAWFTLAMPCPCPWHAVLLKATARPSLDGRAVLWPWEELHGQSKAWARHGKCKLDTAALCKSNEKWERHSKPSAARHGRGTAWTRHGHGVLCVNRPL